MANARAATLPLPLVSDHEPAPYPTSVASARERLLRLGAAALLDEELAQLLGCGEAPASWRTATQTSPVALVRKLGETKAARLLAAVEVGRRSLEAGEKRPKLLNSEEVYLHLRPRLSGLGHEVFHVLCLNARNELLHDVRVATGTVSSCPVDPREVFSAAIASRAAAIVLAHNHPSGDPTPSQEDVQLTEQLRAAGELLCIKVLDHVVIGDGCYRTVTR